MCCDEGAYQVHIKQHVSKFRYSRSILQNDEEINDDVTHRKQARWLKWRNRS